jgi:hypothetical protein
LTNCYPLHTYLTAELVRRLIVGQLSHLHLHEKHLLQLHRIQTKEIVTLREDACGMLLRVVVRRWKTHGRGWGKDACHLLMHSRLKLLRSSCEKKEE